MHGCAVQPLECSAQHPQPGTPTSGKEATRIPDTRCLGQSQQQVLQRSLSRPEKVLGGPGAWGPPPRNVVGAADKAVNQTQGVLSDFKTKKHFRPSFKMPRAPA